MSRQMASLSKVAEYWRSNHADAFPDLLARQDMTRPFCFRCGWRPSLLRVLDVQTAWRYATGWLERAHLQDHFSGGPGTPDNLIPLCTICHHLMPEYPTADDVGDALAWVRGEGHMSCPGWWQRRTRELWPGGQWPGSAEFFRQYFIWSRRDACSQEAFRLAERGDRAGAMALLAIARVHGEDATALVEAFAQPYSHLGAVA